MTEENVNEDDLIRILSQAREASQDIINSESLKFIERWSQETISVPVNYVNFDALLAVIHQDNPDLLGDWDEPVTNREEIDAILGYELAEPFIDYVHANRHANVLQLINVNASLGLLELVIDNDGKIGYVITDDRRITDDIRETLIRLVAAYERGF